MSSEAPLAHIQKQAPTAQPEKSQAELRTALEKKLLASKPHIDAGIAEYEQALANDTFEDASGEAVGSGEKRKEAMQKKLLSMVERAEKMRAQLDSPDDLKNTPEADAASLEPFLQETFATWYSSVENFAQPELAPSTVNPADLDLPARKADTDPTKFGEYTLNPECIGIDFETATITSVDITTEAGYKALPSKDLATVAQYIIDTYSSKYILPDLSFFQWAAENPAKAHAVLDDDSKYYFFPGSVLRNRDGSWNVPYTHWNGSKWHRYANWLANDWDSDCRVVLLEKEL